MQIHMAENIRALRKEKKLTQENLAEIFGVSVAAVSKWEQGTSYPDIATIADIASYFGVSVDYLLGYEWHTKTMEESVALIKKLRNEKRFEEATVEAEKAMKKWPNFFDVVLASAILYSMKGLELKEPKTTRKAISLLYRAIELLGQNKNKEINETMLMNRIANLHGVLGEKIRALEILKDNNVDGQNDIQIALLLVDDEKRYEESIDYAYSGFLDTVCDLMMCTEALGNYYGKKMDRENMEHLVEVMVPFFRSLEKEGKVSYMRKIAILISLLGAVAAVERHDEEAMRHHLENVYHDAVLYETNPSYGYADSWFFHSDKNPTAFDDFPLDSLSSIGEYLEKMEIQHKDPEELRKRLRAGWNQILQEQKVLS